MIVNLGDYLLFLGFIITETNGDARTFIYESPKISFKIYYIKNDKSCLILFYRTTHEIYSYKSKTVHHENEIFRLLENNFVNSLERYKLFLSRKIKINKLLNT